MPRRATCATTLLPIATLAVVCVGITIAVVAVVAVVARWCVPSMPWAAAVALGAIVAPPDAVSAAAIGRKLGLPRRVMTVLSGESLINDGTALVAYLRWRPRSDCRAVFLCVRAPLGPVSAGVVSQIVRAACTRAGLERVGAHRLRHTAATGMLRAVASAQ